MKAITIIQPFAHLICLPESHPMHKRVENRTWPAFAWLIGKDIAIHAGASRRYDGDPVEDWSRHYKVDPAALTFGAVVAVVKLEAVVHEIHIEKHREGDIMLRPGLEWLATHMHSHGPYCWVLANVRPLPKPLPWKGAQGLWSIPDEVIAKAMEVTR